MEIDNILKSLSEQRLKAFVSGDNWEKRDQEIALSNYFKNLNAFQLIVLPIHIFEITLRNHLYRNIAEILGDNRWLYSLVDETQVKPKKAQQRQELLKKFGGDQHDKTYQLLASGKVAPWILGNLSKDIVTATLKPETDQIRSLDHLEGLIISNLNFGFWTQFTSKKISPLHNQGLNKRVFRGHPEISKVESEVNKIRQFRNRVFHHEPLLRQNISYWSDLLWRYIGYICQDTRKYFHPYDLVK